MAQDPDEKIINPEHRAAAEQEPAPESGVVETRPELSLQQYEEMGKQSVEELRATGVPVAENIARGAGTELDPVVETELRTIDNEAGQAGTDLRSDLETDGERTVEQTEVNHEMVEAYKEFDPSGPKVGQVTVVDKDKGKPITLDVRVQQDDKTLEYQICSPQQENFRTKAYAKIQEVKPDELSTRYHAHHPKRSYGNDSGTQPYVYVDMMDSLQNSRYYKGLGQKLHEITVERSFQLGDEGRVQLFAGAISGNSWTEPMARSAGFHESFGFLGKDVYNEDGSLHHTGQSINEALARDRYISAQIQKDIHRKTPTHDVHSDWRYKGTEVQPFMYLPEEAIRRERERIKEHPNLQANAATTEALLKKHEQLRNQHYMRMEAAQLEEQLTKTTQEYDIRRLWDQIGEKYKKAGDTEVAAGYFNKLADSYAQSDHYSDVSDAATYYAKAGNAEKLKEFAGRAGKMAEGYGKYEDAFNFYIQAGDETSADRIRQQLKDVPTNS